MTFLQIIGLITVIFITLVGLITVFLLLKDYIDEYRVKRRQTLIFGLNEDRRMLIKQRNEIDKQLSKIGE